MIEGYIGFRYAWFGVLDAWGLQLRFSRSSSGIKVQGVASKKGLSSTEECQCTKNKHRAFPECVAEGFPF